jgi:hypothetical protein
MKTKTEKILSFMKILALLGGIGFSIECGSQLTSFVISFYNPDYAERYYAIHRDLFRLLNHQIGYFISATTIVIVLSAIKALVWCLIFNLLMKLKVQELFSKMVARKLETLAFLLLGIWLMSTLGNIYIHWLPQKTGEIIRLMDVSGAYFFMAGIMYIVFQIFQRGIEIREENQLTV